MEQKRLLLFVVLSATVIFFWQMFIVPRIAPRPQVVAEQQAENAPAQDEQDPDLPLVAKKPPTNGEVKPLPEQPEEQKAGFARNPQRTIVLGSLDPESGYFLQAKITTQGAAVLEASLNDPLYRDLDDNQKQLQILGEFEGAKEVSRSLQIEMKQLDQKLAPFLTNTRRADWKVLEEVKDADGIIHSVRLGLSAPDGSIEVQKVFSLKKYPVPEGEDFREFRNTQQAGYLIHFDLKLINEGSQGQTLDYQLLGPVGIPLENADNTRKFRDLRIGFLQNDMSVDTTTLYAADIIEEVQEQNVEKYTRAFQFAGVDVQYFAALITPDGKNYKPELVNGEMRSNYSASVEPVLIQQNVKTEEQSRITVKINSDEIELPAGGETEHSYALYAGPKRESLLGPPLKATEIMDFGFFGPVAKLMLWLLTTLHSIGLSYGIAIVCLTVIVRGSLYPLSRKQAVGAQKMKELQPQIAELKKKYGDDREKLGRAQMELFSKNNYNPLAGCLPIFLQLPIFFGLYTALNNAVQLRGTPFLWIDNLAAPDALFKLPFNLPVLGDNFNLLPLITVGLFVVQQKLFMPPPTDKDQELQHKIMNYMMIAMGFLFYRVPAGLCVYFIASSLWGICERKLLDFQAKRHPATSADPNVIEVTAETKKSSPNKKKTDKEEQPAKKGWFARLQEVADQAQAQAALNEKQRDQNSRDKGNGKKSKKRR